MTLEALGYSKELENYRKKSEFTDFDLGRVIAEHKERYIVSTGIREYEAEILGNLRYTAKDRSDFPAVGDWVAVSEFDEDKFLIHSIYPRKSTLERQSVSIKGEKQIIATNVDFAFIVQAVDRDFSINRIERYLTICNSSKIQSIIILNKIDLVDQTELFKIIKSIEVRIKDIPIIALSNVNKEGFDLLRSSIQKTKTYCLLGSSGVGKSSILNTLCGQYLMKTDSISEHSERGRHVTTHRELRILDSGGIIIDNPGMREVGIADSSGGLEMTFDQIEEFGKNCKFKDCTHQSEKGCAVLEALENGEIDHSSYENYLKMEREKEHYASTVAEKRRKGKGLAKIIKHMKKTNNSNKY